MKIKSLDISNIEKIAMYFSRNPIPPSSTEEEFSKLIEDYDICENRGRKAEYTSSSERHSAVRAAYEKNINSDPRLGELIDVNR